MEVNTLNREAFGQIGTWLPNIRTLSPNIFVDGAIYKIVTLYVEHVGKENSSQVSSLEYLFIYLLTIFSSSNLQLLISNWLERPTVQCY